MTDDGKLIYDMGIDAREWAREFMVRFGKRKDTIDEGLMLAWFANALEAGRSGNVEDIQKSMREVIAVQGADGNWDFDSYMRGMFNGMELMLAIAEQRDPIYRSAPATYRHDGNAGTMTTQEVSERLEAWLKTARDGRVVGIGYDAIDQLLDTVRDCAAESKLPWER